MPGYNVTDPLFRCVLPFQAEPAEVHMLRRAALRQLSQWGAPVAADEAGLLVTELAANVFKHVGAGASATLVLEWRGERLRLEVHDRSSVVPVSSALECDAECGRGLHLVASLATDWGTVLTAAGKAVWCEVAADARSGIRRLMRAADMLQSYAAVGRGAVSEGLLEQSAIELIADLLHWTASRGRDPDAVLDQAQMHFEAEAGVV